MEMPRLNKSVRKVVKLQPTKTGPGTDCGLQRRLGEKKGVILASTA